MNSSPRASTSIIVAGISAILCGVIGAFSTLSALILFSTSGITQSAPFPAGMRPVLYGVWIITLLCALFVVVTGIQVMRLRNWARISMLVVAGCFLFFGLMGIVVMFVSALVSIPMEPTVPRGLLLAVLAVTYGIPTAISVWWLIIFTRRSAVAQFHALAAIEPPRPASSLSLFNNPDCPLAVRIIGWYLGSFALVIPFIPFLPKSAPAILFGHVFFGPAAASIYFFNFAIVSIPGIGLLLLKRWSYPLTFFSQLLACANAVYSTLSPSYQSTVRAMFEKMNLPEIPSYTEQMLGYSRYFSLIGLVFPAAILVTLFVSRQKFYEARLTQLLQSPRLKFASFLFSIRTTRNLAVDVSRTFAPSTPRCAIIFV